MVIFIYLGNNDDDKIGTAKPEFWHRRIQDFSGRYQYSEY